MYDRGVEIRLDAVVTQKPQISLLAYPNLLNGETKMSSTLRNVSLENHKFVNQPYSSKPLLFRDPLLKIENLSNEF